jgi:hypothetical protein
MIPRDSPEIAMGLVVGGARPGVMNSNVFDFLEVPSDFGLHFAEESVLTLPEGYTSSSVDGDISNNQWRGTVSTGTQSWGALKSSYR